MNSAILDIFYADLAAFPVKSGEFARMAYEINSLNKVQRDTMDAAQDFSVNDDAITAVDQEADDQEVVPQQYVQAATTVNTAIGSRHNHHRRHSINILG